MSESYSIRMLKKSAFEHEILNVIDLLSINKDNKEIVTVRNYLSKRIEELKK